MSEVIALSGPAYIDIFVQYVWPKPETINVCRSMGFLRIVLIDVDIHRKRNEHDSSEYPHGTLDPQQDDCRT
jgi:hypothetical protein